jgi:hypothetical protein
MASSYRVGLSKKEQDAKMVARERWTTAHLRPPVYLADISNLHTESVTHKWQ